MYMHLFVIFGVCTDVSNTLLYHTKHMHSGYIIHELIHMVIFTYRVLRGNSGHFFSPFVFFLITGGPIDKKKKNMGPEKLEASLQSFMWWCFSFATTSFKKKTHEISENRREINNF